MNVALCREDGRYLAGGLLRASWRVSRVAKERLQSIEVSVLWHTDGKGDEDLHVHHFHRVDAAELKHLDLGVPQELDCRLPPTPLSYHGRLVSLRWCLRVRLFMDNGKEIVTEHPFFLVSGTTAHAGPIDTDRSATEKSSASAERVRVERLRADEARAAMNDTVGVKSAGEETIIFRRLKRPRTFLRSTDRR